MKIILPGTPGLEMSFIRIEPGSFLMGARGYDDNAEPIHRVRISQAFYLSQTPVTQAQFAVWTGLALTDHKNYFEGNPKHPAESMSWQEVREYCVWLTGVCSEQEQFPEGHEADLPSEAQWEYACWGGAEAEQNYQGEYQGPQGGCDGAEALKSLGWFRENSNSTTHPVAEKSPNSLGLYDMHGNVWEWCRDVWEEDAYKWREDGVVDPEVKSKVELVGMKEQQRVIRGGSWGNTARSCRSAYRNRRFPDNRYWNQGFRVGLFPGPSNQQQE